MFETFNGSSIVYCNIQCERNQLDPRHGAIVCAILARREYVHLYRAPEQRQMVMPCTNCDGGHLDVAYRGELCSLYLYVLRTKYAGSRSKRKHTKCIGLYRIWNYLSSMQITFKNKDFRDKYKPLNFECLLLGLKGSCSVYSSCG